MSYDVIFQDAKSINLMHRIQLDICYIILIGLKLSSISKISLVICPKASIRQLSESFECI